VSREPFERTRLGKIRRHKLKEHFERAQSGESGQGRGPLSYEEMDTADRELLDNEQAAAAWRVLTERYPDRRLTPDSDMEADVGVDSLEWLDLSMVLGSRAGIELDEQDIESIDSVRDLLRHAARMSGGKSDRPDPVERPLDYLNDEEKTWLEPVSGARLRLYRSVMAVSGPLLRLVFRLEARGVEDVVRAVRDEDRPVIFTPNHTSYLDPVMLVLALPMEVLERTHFIGVRDAAFANPVLAWISRTAQTVPIEPGSRPGVGLAAGSALLEQGRNLIWFPEGMRSRTGRLVRFQPGLGRILKRRDALVVPVRIEGAYEAMPPGRWWIKPVRVRVTFATPLPAGDLDPGEESEDRAGGIVQALREKMLEMDEPRQDRNRS
jgi:long-chain acyl-CoA synthetase